MAGVSDAGDPLKTKRNHWVKRSLYLCWSIYFGIASNVLSEHIALVWVPLGLAILGLVHLASWLRIAQPRVRSTQWFALAALGGAIAASTFSIFVAPDKQIYFVVSALTLGAVAVLTMSAEDAWQTAGAILVTCGGIALAGRAVHDGIDTIRGLFLLYTGVGALLAGGLLLLGRRRACGVTMIVVGVLGFTAGLTLGTAGLIGAAFFIAAGLFATAIGIALTTTAATLTESTTLVRLLVTAAALYYLVLGVLAILDHRFVLAAADLLPSTLALVLVVVSLRTEVAVGAVLFLFGIPLLVDGVQSLTLGKPLAGAVEILGGLLGLAMFASRYRELAVAFRRYALSEPTNRGGRPRAR